MTNVVKKDDEILFHRTKISSMCIRKANQKGKFQVTLEYKDTPENEELKNRIIAVNKDMIRDHTTNKNIKPGVFVVMLKTNATNEDGSLRYLEVLDSDGNFLDIDERPGFSYETDSGEAACVGQVFKGSQQGFGIALRMVRLYNLDIKERPVSEARAQLRGLLESTHNAA